MKLVHGLLLVLLAAPGCASVSTRVAASPPQPAPPPQLLVFAVDGAGNYQGTSRALRAWVAEDGLPIHVHTVEWSHGRRRPLADLVDQCHSLREGQRLAEQIQCYRRELGTALPVTIVAHSAGTMPALVAAGLLPPDSLERIILLAPSVSRDYDLRPALRAAREGIDVFYSARDRGYLGLVTTLFGSSDGRRGAVAGRVGFRLPEGTGEDACLYARLRQHAWTADLNWTGHTGGHFTVQEPGFLRTQLQPLLLPGRPVVVPAAKR